MKKRVAFKIITFGCRTNQAESREIGEEIIKKVGKVAQVDKSRKADVVIINTCCVTGKAEKEVRQAIRKVKRENPECFLVVCGCWVNKIKNKDLALLDLVDLMVTNEEKEKIGKILKGHFSHSTIKKFSHYRYEDKYSQSKKALIKIQDGCDNFCTYCIVPYVRGRSFSRPADEIIKEINRLVKQGIEEVVLTGINIADYRFKIQDSRFKKLIKNEKLDKFKNGLVELIKLILVETEVKKISFGSMGLRIFDEEFIKLFFSQPRLTSHFHIPLQSGCEATLKRMNRGYKIKDVRSKMEELKKKIPNLTFSTDIIVGFPGETEEEFKESLAAIKEIKRILGKRFTKIHVFRYSSREETIAAKMLGAWGRVSEKTKKQRSAKVAQIISRSSTN